MLRETYPRTFVLLALLFALFTLFLYAPTLTITVLIIVAAIIRLVDIRKEL